MVWCGGRATLNSRDELHSGVCAHVFYYDDTNLWKYAPGSFEAPQQLHLMPFKHKTETKGGNRTQELLAKFFRLPKGVKLLIQCNLKCQTRHGNPPSGSCRLLRIPGYVSNNPSKLLLFWCFESRFDD